MSKPTDPCWALVLWMVGQALREKVMEAKSWDDLLHVITHEYACVDHNCI